MEVNREIYNQFRRNDSQLPNNYYQVEITADELEMLKSYVANPNNNYYSLLGMNCATGVVKAWNTTFSDRPELWLKGNYTGISADPVSLAAEIGLMKYRKGIEDGKSGTDSDREIWEKNYRPYGEEFDESYDYDGDKKANTPEDREVYKSTRDMIIGEYDLGLEFDEVYSEFNKEYDYDIDATTGAVLFYESEIDD